LSSPDRLLDIVYLYVTKFIPKGAWLESRDPSHAPLGVNSVIPRQNA